MPGTEGGIVGISHTGMSNASFSFLTGAADDSPNTAGKATLSKPDTFPANSLIKVSSVLSFSRTLAILVERISVGLIRNLSSSGRLIEDIRHSAPHFSKLSATNFVLKSRNPAILTTSTFLPAISWGDESCVKSENVSHVGFNVPIGVIRK